jgi:hypothetical protein
MIRTGTTDFGDKKKYEKVSIISWTGAIICTEVAVARCNGR